jgi:hypothetical protein
MKRRSFLKKAAATASLPILNPLNLSDSTEIKVLNPRNRVPVSFIIDDSTALVNMAYFGIPQFKEVFPDQYRQDWRKLPREIPDAFVLEFLEWCDQHGVKGKYSMVPYPACTGWLHRFIPGWSKRELEESIRIVRELAQPNWDIHPEMISHTRVIDVKTGLPYPYATSEYMENWEWSQNRSADELGEYIAYASRILKEVGLDCTGVTTPGGFAHRNIPNLALGTQRAIHEVYGHRVSHFFRDVITEAGKSVQPEIHHAVDLDTEQASCSVHIIACTGDWFGGWDGLTPGDANRFITPDLSSGRMVEVIETGEPAIFLCHWPGIYYNGEKLGFDIFKTVVTRLHEKYAHLIWMTLSEIADYWAAREHTSYHVTNKTLEFQAPFAAKLFTLQIPESMKPSILRINDQEVQLSEVQSLAGLMKDTFYRSNQGNIVCFDLPKGSSLLATK